MSLSDINGMKALALLLHCDEEADAVVTKVALIMAERRHDWRLAYAIARGTSPDSNIWEREVWTEILRGEGLPV